MKLKSNNLFVLAVICGSLIFNSCSKSDDSNNGSGGTTTTAPTADFSFAGNNAAAPASVSFTNQSTNATSYSWSFGDGGSSTSSSPIHIFVTGGTYNVKLTATGSGGTTDKTKSVTVLAGVTVANMQTITLDSISFTKPGGGNWDPSDGPDVYIKVTKNGTVLQNQNAFGLVSNISQSSLPLAWVFSPDVPVSPLTDTVNIEIWDDDGTTDEMMGSISFNPSSYGGQPTPVTLTNGAYKVRLGIQWY